jgi:hypothetical protein
MTEEEYDFWNVKPLVNQDRSEAFQPVHTCELAVDSEEGAGVYGVLHLLQGGAEIVSRHLHLPAIQVGHNTFSQGPHFHMFKGTVSRD